ncbi:MAG TPA: hypothetical protein VLT82_16730 [Myxococcaceae bacterium]|nr:hypothetical protein [Myxococcaceae bacterium]
MRALLMRFTLVPTLLLAVACNRDLVPRPPVETRLYYPTGVAFVPPASPDGGLGRLYVASSNFDRRFDIGWVTAVDLAQVRTAEGRTLPLPGAAVAPLPDGGSDQGRPVQFTQLATTTANLVTISPFAGLATVDDAGTRLFIPSRSEGDEVAIMDITQPSDGGVPLRCFFSGGTDCTVDALRLAVEQTPGSFGIPAAPQPYSVTLAPDSDQIYVTHLRPASSPAQSVTNLQNFLVTLHQSELDAARAAWATDGGYTVPDSAFSAIGRGATNSIVVTTDFLYVSGRAKLVSTDPDVLLRVVDRASNLVAYPQLQLVWASLDARALQLRPDGQRLYLAVDNPAALLVIDVGAPPAPELAPSFTLVRAVPLPEGPNDVQLLTRTGRAPLVVVSCSVDGSLAFYDDDLGQIAALVPGVGAVPFAITIDRRGDFARLYVSNFGDGRIAVVDVPLSVAAAGGRLAPRLVAHIGAKQYCLLATDDRNCVDSTP